LVAGHGTTKIIFHKREKYSHNTFLTGIKHHFIAQKKKKLYMDGTELMMESKRVETNIIPSKTIIY
jgi:hypothetical protein